MAELTLTDAGLKPIADKVMARYEGLLDRVGFYIPYRVGLDDAEWRKLTRRFNG